MNSQIAIIDLGTNTFHLLIAQHSNNVLKTVYQQSTPARIGVSGINKNIITEEATLRALNVLCDFKLHLEKFEVNPENIFTFGTSAIRNAANREDFKTMVFKKTGIIIKEIDGDMEAKLIYQGVNQAVKLGTEPSLIMDIGGGSVEFIIANQDQIFWKQSFEIGGQRLMEKYMSDDTLTIQNRKKLYNYLDEVLIPLANAVHQYAPKKLVGSAGAFETIIDIENFFTKNNWTTTEIKEFSISLESFYRIYAQILSSSRSERISIPGMIPLRVDMIVVAICLIEYVIKSHGINEIQVSRFALKEGALLEYISL